MESTKPNLATGILVDPYIPAYSPIAKRYQRLARASLAIENVMTDTSLVALYSIFGLCYYLQSSDEKMVWKNPWCSKAYGQDSTKCQLSGLYMLNASRTNHSEYRWGCVRNDVYSSTRFSYGDPEYFKLSDIAAQRRRRVFWEIYLYDMWQVGTEYSVSDNR